MDDFGAQLGRLHPVLVHLPIGFLLLLVALEILGRLAVWRRPDAPPVINRATRTAVLSLATLAAFATMTLGWLLARSGDYHGVLVTRHAYAGYAVTGVTFVLLLAHLREWRRTYPVLLAVVFLAVLATGYLGGLLTHGRDHLARFVPDALHQFLAGEVAPEPPPRARSAADARLYADAVQPILVQRCGSCHGPTKTNGDLRLDTWEALQLGGKHGPVLHAGDAVKSPLVQRILLPLGAKEHMPPAGKPQLTDDEVNLLEWWVANGASNQSRVATATPPPAVEDMLATLFPELKPPPPDRTATMARADEIATRLRIVIRPLSPTEPWLDVSARLRATAFGDAELAELAPLATAIAWLDLGETAVTDVGLTTLGTMTRLRRLHLDRTTISDVGLASLAALSRLEYLNLYGTDISDAGIAELRPLTQLRALYVWQTRATPGSVQVLGKHVVDERMILRWEGEIADRQRRIAAERFTSNFGEALPAALEIPAPVPPPSPATSATSPPP
jgi:uncharacterized membrane protein